MLVSQVKIELSYMSKLVSKGTGGGFDFGRLGTGEFDVEEFNVGESNVGESNVGEFNVGEFDVGGKTILIFCTFREGDTLGKVPLLCKENFGLDDLT